MRFLWPHLQIWCTVQPSHQCKMPQEERRKGTLSIKMSPAAGGGGFDPLTPWPGALPWTPLGAPTQTHVIAMVPSILNSLLCSTNFFKLCLVWHPPLGLCPKRTLCSRYRTRHVCFWLSSFLSLWCIAWLFSFALDIFRTGSLTYLLIKYSICNLGWSLGHFKKLRTSCIVRLLMLSVCFAKLHGSNSYICSVAE